MTTGMIIFISLKLLFGFILAFLAILAWAKTRQEAWIFIIAGTLIRYMEIIYSILNDLEVINLEWGYVGELPLLQIVLTILPLALMGIGFLLFLIRNKRY
jgi:hypothetical protein